MANLQNLKQGLTILEGYDTDPLMEIDRDKPHLDIYTGSTEISQKDEKTLLQLDWTKEAWGWSFYVGY